MEDSRFSADESSDQRPQAQIHTTQDDTSHNPDGDAAREVFISEGGDDAVAETGNNNSGSVVVGMEEALPQRSQRRRTTTDEDTKPLNNYQADTENDENNTTSNTHLMGDSYNGSGGSTTANDNNNNNNHTTERSDSPHQQHNVDSRNANWHLVVHEWADGTSIHGVNQVFEHHHYQTWRRLLWAALIATSCSLMIVQINKLIKQYRSYSVNTSVETVVTTQLEFPQVTLCNYNPLSQSAIDFYNLTDPINETELEWLSQPLEDFIPNGYTRYNDELLPGDVSAIWKRKITYYGQCWTFDANAGIRRAGNFGGLEVLTFVNQSDFPYADSTEYAAVLVFTQQPGTDINDRVPFVTAMPGERTTVNLHKTTFSRVTEKPWSKCTGAAPAYTQTQCQADCFNANLRKTCQCREWGDSNDPQLPYCEYTDETTECKTQLYNNETQLQQSNACDCQKPPCSQTRYQGFVTSMLLSNQLLERYSQLVNRSDDFIYENYAWIHINYDTIQYESWTESKQIEFSVLLGSIGGTMGLFLGISVISLFELFGDLGGIRLVPRMLGYRHLYGVGARGGAGRSS